MAKKTYNVVVQAWDNCGNVYKTPLSVPMAGFGRSRENAAAINDSGQVAGSSAYPDGTSHAALWSPNGSIQDLGILLGDTSSGGLVINTAGHVAG